MQPNGRARSQADVVDLSVLTSGSLNGVSAVIGPTQWGEVEKPVLVKTWDDFVLNFGGFTENWKTPDTTNFPLLCYRALNAGATLYVCRVAHHSDGRDVEGTKPTGTISEGPTFTGKFIGNYEVQVTITETLIGSATKVYAITEVPLGNGADYSKFSRTVDNLSSTLTDEIIKKINQSLRFVQLTSAASTALKAGTVKVTGGTQDLSDVDDADYIGDVDAKTGIHAFDEIDFDYIAAPDKTTPAVDVALASYAVSRGDIRAKLSTPVGIKADAILEYRNQTGTYNNAGGGVDTWLASMYTGGLLVKHPVTGETVEISEIGDVLGCTAKKDSENYPWYAAAGAKRGKIYDCFGVVYNLGTNAMSKNADAVDNAGVNMVINHRSFGPVIWGNSTLQKKDTMLKHENVADCIMYVMKACKPVIDYQLFDPNDIDTWKTIYRKIKSIMDEIKSNRGVFDYLYQGDQDVSDVSECTVNNTDDIDAGMYVFHLFVKPTPAMKYVNMKVIVTNSGVSFDVAGEELENV